MKKAKKLLSLLLFLSFFAIIATSCVKEHFLRDRAYRKKVEQDFERKKEQLPAGDLFAVFDEQDLSAYEREALMFLYAYMPVGDITDYPGSYYLENIRLSRRAKAEMPWGKDIPEDIFRHFVLPIRVSSENTDDSRRVFYDELKDRIKNMNLHDAVLEVNHWCHEKVVYTPTDGRTSSPLSTVKTAYGRCGEEAVFTVAALRAVGIPARQVYTPRWAHTDDNHAWVEAWVDGKWYYMGACEPEPELNMGWFSGPASRGMLIHTNAFGRYEGEEEVMQMTPIGAEINVIGNYAPSAKASVEVVDADGKPVDNARVEFKVYNYAEFYPVAVRQTNEAGIATLGAGMGDMLVWASKDGKFGYTQISFGQDESVKVTLDGEQGAEYTASFDMVPPPESTNLVQVTEEQRAGNARRLSQEDSIRNAYVATFMTEESAGAFVARNSLPETATKYLVASRGNHETIATFLLNAQQKNTERKAVALLSVVSAKDLRDASLDVLEDHLYNTPMEIEDTALFNTRVLDPRVSYEMILPYKAIFKDAFPAKKREEFIGDPLKLMEWSKNNIAEREPGMLISPTGVWRSRVSDSRSLKIFYVSMARSLGIPAWVDGVTGKIQYMKPGSSTEVMDIDLDRVKSVRSPSGRLVLNYKPTTALVDPNYYANFSIAKFQDGTFRTLGFDEGDVDMGGGTAWSSRFRNGVKLDEGYYMLTTGVRQSDGSVLTRLAFFNIGQDETTTVDLVFRDDAKKQAEVIGHLDAGSSFLPVNGGRAELLSQYAGSGYYVLAILGPGQEPTNHALRDIAAVGKNFEMAGQRFVFLFRDREQSEKYRATDFPGLPATVIYGIDESGDVTNRLAQTLGIADTSLLPIVVIANADGEVVFESQGYTIGLGEQLFKEIGSLK